MFSTAVKLVLGFILPVSLPVIVIPRESFIHSSRAVIGVLLAGLLRVSAVFLRFLGNISKYVGKSLVNIYDLVIFLPLWIEGLLLNKEGKKIPNPLAVGNESTALNSTVAPAAIKKRTPRKTSASKEKEVTEAIKEIS